VGGKDLRGKEPGENNDEEEDEDENKAVARAEARQGNKTKAGKKGEGKGREKGLGALKGKTWLCEALVWGELIESIAFTVSHFLVSSLFFL